MKRADCMPGGALYARPCPYTSCRHHLTNMGRRSGRQPTVTRDESQSCALDVAEEGRQKLVTIGNLLGMTRERVRQIEAQALAHARRVAKRLDLDLGAIIARPEHHLAAAEDGASKDDVIDTRGRSRDKLRQYHERWAAKKRAGGHG
jgi:hypothetical protein